MSPQRGALSKMGIIFCHGDGIVKTPSAVMPGLTMVIRKKVFAINHATRKED